RSRAGLGLRLLLGEGSRRDPADALRVGDGVDLDNLAVGNGEPHHHGGLPICRDDYSGAAIHHRGMHLHPWTREARGRALDGLPGDGSGARERNGGEGTVRAWVEAEHDLWIEHVDERAKIALTRRQKEGVHHVALASEIGVWNRYAPPATARPAGKLARRHRR